MRTCWVVSGAWPQQRQRELSHFFQRHIICPVAEWPEANLENHSQYRGEAENFLVMMSKQNQHRKYCRHSHNHFFFYVHGL